MYNCPKLFRCLWPISHCMGIMSLNKKNRIFNNIKLNQLYYFKCVYRLLHLHHILIACDAIEELADI